MLSFKSVFLTTILLKLLRLSEAYIITIDARAQDCFHEKGPKMSKSNPLIKKEPLRRIAINRSDCQQYPNFHFN